MTIPQAHGVEWVAPVFGSGRGLKHPRQRSDPDLGRRPGLRIGARIETARLADEALPTEVAPVFGSGRGLKPTQSSQSFPSASRPGLRIGARIETRPCLCQVP